MADPDPLAPLASDGSPGQAFATHKARANGIARFFAQTRKLSAIGAEQAGEDNTTALIAHYHTLSLDPSFAAPGEPPSVQAAPAALRRLNRGNGLVGTKGASTERDYDMALRGLIVLLYRYRQQLGPDNAKFITDTLLPGDLVGGHPPGIEVVEFSLLNIDAPETENHLLMIESSRYLINQLRFDATRDARFDNTANGLSRWLMGFMQVILRHDFLEFNSRPYARLAIHPLLNLHEFARDAAVRRAAQMLLDYVFTKYAISSNRGRRVTPFRRQQHRINHQGNLRNYLYSDMADQVTGYFLAYTGLLGPDGKPAPFPPACAFNAVLGGLAAYRPPPAAYTLAMKGDAPPSLHRFYHGKRPRLPASPEDAEGGVEIYHRSPSFLISAGGSFLNSGYGSDEVDLFKQAWEQTSRAQATTVIPTRADTLFHDLLRFEPYPDPRVDPYNDDPEDPDTLHAKSVNYGVVRNFAAGANMRPAEHKTVLEEFTSHSPALAFHNGILFIAFKGSGNDNLNIGRVQATTVMGIDGVEGIDWKKPLPATSDAGPALASHAGRLFMAWRGSGNKQLNVAFSDDDGQTFKDTTTLRETSEYAPALAADDRGLYLAWTGEDDHLNVATVTLFANTAGGFGIEGLGRKLTLGDTSDQAPALACHLGRLFLAWTGEGEGQLNLLVSGDSGATFGGKTTFSRETSDRGPALAVAGGRLTLAWRGSGNENLNVARVGLIGNTQGAFSIGELDGKVSLGDTSEEAPAIGDWNGLPVLAWKGTADDNIDLRISRDGRFAPIGPWIFADKSDLGFYLAAYRTPPTHPDQLVEPLDSLGFAYIVEKSEIDRRDLTFDGFKNTIQRANANLPPTLDYGGRYVFTAPDGRRIGMWFEFIDQKYTPRVGDLAEPIDSFANLPLVSGEFMRAPGGHDGLVEIRHPGCENAPLILDFRDPANPVRTENRAACPGPWLERLSATVDLSKRLEGVGKVLDARAARSDAARLYDDLLRADTAVLGPKVAPAMIDALAAMGIDFSVGRPDLLDWLTNPDFTPYPALAQALLGLGRTLKSPLYLDVVAYNYEHTRGVASPRKVGDVKPDVLKAAMVAGWNERYGQHLAPSGFDAMFAA